MAYVEEKLTKELSVHPSFKEDGIQQDSRSSSEETTNNDDGKQKKKRAYFIGPNDS